MQSLKVTLRIVPWVSVPIFKAESRECSTQFVMVIFSHTPYRRDMGPVDFTTMASSPVETMQLAITTLRQQSGSMPSLLAPRSSFRILFRQCAHSGSLPYAVSKSGIFQRYIAHGKVFHIFKQHHARAERFAGFGAFMETVIFVLSKNTWSPWP